MKSDYTGGGNHGDWMYNIKQWDRKKIEKEILWGIKMLKKAGIDKITSFASPGWNNSPFLFPMLSKQGFKIVADWHGKSTKIVEPIDKNNNLFAVTTNLTGEPGGIGYIEHKRAQGLNEKEILNIFKRDLSNIKHLGIIYDHPYFVGIKELSVIEKMIKMAQDMNFKIVTLSSILRYIDFIKG